MLYTITTVSLSTNLPSPHHPSIFCNASQTRKQRIYIACSRNQRAQINDFNINHRNLVICMLPVHRVCIIFLSTCDHKTFDTYFEVFASPHHRYDQIITYTVYTIDLSYRKINYLENKKDTLPFRNYNQIYSSNIPTYLHT